MKCSNLNEDMVNRHLANDAKCVCGTGKENAEHYFKNCPRYDALRTKYDLSNYEIGVILYGDANMDFNGNLSLFEKVGNYISESKRFY